MGILSQKGAAPGLVNGRLAEPDTKPNVVCSENGTQSERAIAPIKGSMKAVTQAIETKFLNLWMMSKSDQMAMSAKFVQAAASAFLIGASTASGLK